MNKARPGGEARRAVQLLCPPGSLNWDGAFEGHCQQNEACFYVSKNIYILLHESYHSFKVLPAFPQSPQQLSHSTSHYVPRGTSFNSVDHCTTLHIRI